MQHCYTLLTKVDSMKKVTTITIAAFAVFLLTGCGNQVPTLSENTQPAVTAEDFVYNGHNFGPNRTVDYKDGVMAGYQTSNGEYTKDHARFNTSLDYHDGWEHGRLHCKGTP